MFAHKKPALYGLVRWVNGKKKVDKDIAHYSKDPTIHLIIVFRRIKCPPPKIPEQN